MRRAAVTLSIALISLGLSSIPARAASIDGAPQIKGLQFDTSSVSVFGLNVATVKVSVHLTDGDGVDDSVNDANSLLPTPFITIQHIAPPVGVDDSQIAFLTLASTSRGSRPTLSSPFILLPWRGRAPLILLPASGRPFPTG